MTNSIKRKIINRRKGSSTPRISSSKYVAQQRTKARSIVRCLQEKNIKLIALDFDKTFISIHTNGRYRGSVESLIESIRPTFYYLVQEILDSPAFGQTLHLSIVSFSSQEQLIRKVLELAFQTSKTEQILIQCNTPDFIRNLSRKEFLGKEYHISSVVSNISNTTITSDEILLLDDDVRNILMAEEFGHHVLEIRDGITLDILKEFSGNLVKLSSYCTSTLSDK